MYVLKNERNIKINNEITIKLLKRKVKKGRQKMKKRNSEKIVSCHFLGPATIIVYILILKTIIKS